jgi:hypothetical protein
LETLGGLWELLRLAIKTRGRLRGRYWKWRYETAFGSEPDKYTTRWQRVRAMLDYARWVYRMKRR